MLEEVVPVIRSSAMSICFPSRFVVSCERNAVRNQELVSYLLRVYTALLLLCCELL